MSWIRDKANVNPDDEHLVSSEKASLLKTQNPEQQGALSEGLQGQIKR